MCTCNNISSIISFIPQDIMQKQSIFYDGKAKEDIKENSVVDKKGSLHYNMHSLIIILALSSGINIVAQFFEKHYSHTLRT